ncbi:MAG: ATP-binding protein [Bacteroidota bacterium]
MRATALSIPAHLGYVSLAASVVRSAAQLMNLSDAVTNRAELSVVEALDNVIEHACGNDPSRAVSLVIGALPGAMQVVIRDDGPAFDMVAAGKAAARTDTALRAATLPDSGFGLALINETTDIARYERTGGWNELRLVFFAS